MTLDEIALKHGTDKASNLHDYCVHYEGLLGHLRCAQLTILEIGVAGGASIKMWQEFFPKAKVYGIDICPITEMPVYVGNQNDTNFLEHVIKEVGMLDVVIDDGSHLLSDFRISFKYLINFVKPGGWYFIEDLDTCSNPEPKWDGNAGAENWFSPMIFDLMFLREKSQFKSMHISKSLFGVQKQ